MSADTTIEAARIQRKALAKKTASQRATMALEMSELVKQLVIDGLRSRHPNISQEALQLELIKRLHGRELANAVVAFRPLNNGS